MEKNIALETLVELTNANLGYVPSTPTEFNDLSRMIKAKTGRSISLSSIKRIWGYVRYEGFPSVSTLNNLAQYNGYKDWDTFMLGYISDRGADSAFLKESVVSADNLTAGDCLLLSWGDGKSCEIEYLEAMRFRVNDSRNIKLEPGDTFTVRTLSLGHPLYVSDIRRGDMYLPAYIGAKKGGLTKIVFRSR